MSHGLPFLSDTKGTRHEPPCGRRRGVFADHPRPARQTAWVVYAKPRFAGPQQVLDYVGRYTHRVAIANQRLLDLDDGHVRFRYQDYRADRREREKTMTLGATEFTRREKLTQCRRLLHMAPPATCAPTAAGPADYRDRYEALTGVSLRTCPRGQDGRMLIVERLIGARGRLMILDSSRSQAPTSPAGRQQRTTVTLRESFVDDRVVRILRPINTAWRFPLRPATSRVPPRMPCFPAGLHPAGRARRSPPTMPSP